MTATKKKKGGQEGGGKGGEGEGRMGGREAGRRGEKKRKDSPKENVPGLFSLVSSKAIHTYPEINKLAIS